MVYCGQWRTAFEGRARTKHAASWLAEEIVNEKRESYQETNMATLSVGEPQEMEGEWQFKILHHK